MLEYQATSITNFGQGITDRYRSSGTRFAKLENFDILDNGSAKIRNGLGCFVEGSFDTVRGLKRIGDTNDIAIMASTSPIVKSDTGVISPTIDNYVATVTEGQVATSRWRNCVFFQPKGDYLCRVVKTSAGEYVAERGGMPLVNCDVAGDGIDTDLRIYAICLERSYTDDDGIIYTEYSPEAYGSVYTDGTSETFTLTNLAYTMDTVDVTSSLNTLYNNLKLVLFISEPAGQTVYRAAEITAPITATAAFTSVALGSINENEKGTFFTEVDKIPAPVCNFFAMSENTGYYGGVVVSGVEKPYRLYQSVQGMPISVISDAYLDFSSAILGVNSIGSVPVVLTSEYCYRVEGSIGVDDSGYMKSVKIQNSEGGIGHNSMVQVGKYLYYAGTDGVYLTDGYTAQNITGPDLYKSYISLISDSTDWHNITATYNRDANIIIFNFGDGTMWALNVDTRGFTTYSFSDLGYELTSLTTEFLPKRSMVTEASLASGGFNSEVGDTTTVYTFILDVTTIRNIVIGGIYYLYGTVDGWFEAVADSYSLRDKTVTFTVTQPNTTVFNETTIQTDSGVFEHDVEYTMHTILGTDTNILVALRNDYSSDVLYDTTFASTFVTDRKSILYDWLTAGIDYGLPVTNKWVKDVEIVVKTNNKYAMEPYTVREADNNEAAMKFIGSIEQFRAFDDMEIWGRGAAKWFPSAIVKGKRHIPRGFCKSLSNQVGGRSTPISLYQSIDYGKAEAYVDTSALRTELVIELNDGMTMPFPFDSGIDSYISIILDGVIGRKIPVYSLSSDQLTLTTAIPNDVDLTTGDVVDWVLYSYPKEQDFEITSATINWAPISTMGSGSKQGSDLGSNY